MAMFASEANQVMMSERAYGFGDLDAVRTVFFCSLAVILGVEIIFSSVFLSMLGISRDTYIGE